MILAKAIHPAKLNEHAMRAALEAELVNCPYCTGFWFAGVITLSILFPTAYGDLLLLWFGIAGAQAFLEGCRDNR